MSRLPSVLRHIAPMLFVAGWLASAFAASAAAADLDAARRAARAGQHERVIREATAALKETEDEEEWALLLARSQLALGRHEAAEETVTGALQRLYWSLRLRFLAHEVDRDSGRPERARLHLLDIQQYARGQSWRYRDAESLSTLARAMLLNGADPKQVLDALLTPAKKLGTNTPAPWLAAGELALEKQDFDLAAKQFSEAATKFPGEPDAHFGLARALASGDARGAAEALDATLRIHSNHVPALLLVAERQLDAEDHAGMERTVARVLAVNPRQPEAWALRAVAAHLEAQPKGGARLRDHALWHGRTDARVDWFIGARLARKYRFAEAAEFQRQALADDERFLPAKRELAQDFLRLGEDAEGWRLVEEVHREDAYDVEAFNLLTLRDMFAEKFRTLTNAHFSVRMPAREAAIYGPRVMALLERARVHLTARYGLELTQRTTVEIFGDQKDFAVRTLGVPHNPGFLGVCFGCVVTANSPAATGGTASWEAVLWHEFCHVVTLTLTRNRIPRWLSEGISVHEERQASRAWGQAMTPAHRARLLGGGRVPVAELSGAFLNARDDDAMQFAYFQSSLVVEFIVEKSGMEALRAVLRDLGEGVPINAALAARVAPMERLEEEFAAFASARAERLAPGLSWEKPDRATLAEAGDGTEWVKAQPTNYHALTYRAGALAAARRWAEAKAPLETLVRLHPGQTGQNAPALLLARAHRELGETNAERAVLERFAAQDGDAGGAFLRLIELGETAGDWPQAATNAARLLGVNPLLPQPWRALARAGEERGDRVAAVAAWETLLLMEPADEAEVHHRLARLLREDDPARARLHVLRALEDAPRHRAALRLLVELKEKTGTK